MENTLGNAPQCFFPALVSHASPGQHFEENGTHRDSVIVVHEELETVQLNVWLDKEAVRLSSLLEASWAIILRSYIGQDGVLFACSDSKRCDLSSISFLGYVDSDEEAVELKNEFGIVVCLSPSATDQWISISIEFSRDILSGPWATKIAKTLCHTMREVITRTNSTVGDLDVCEKDDVNSIFEWNGKMGIQKYPESCVHDMISEKCIEQPNKTAISAWDGELTYSELDELSSNLASQLRDMGILAGCFVPLSFEKSKWAVVALLGVLKAGAAYVFLDSSHPETRLRSICETVKSDVVLCSPQHASLASRLTSRVIPIGDNYQDYLRRSPSEPTDKPAVGPSSIIYAIFTSGTTGEPKGIILEHAAVYAACIANGKALSVTSESRVLQFASYTFNPSNRDMLLTLLFGGCICIPSETDRLNNLTNFINAHSVNWASLTPTITSVLSPESVPKLQTLVLGGEPMKKYHIEAWAGKVHLFNAYALSECCGIAAVVSDFPTGGPAGNIGVGCGSRLWVVDAENPYQLMPIGAVGELAVEGISIARKYLNDEKRTRENFLDTTQWLHQFHGNRGSQTTRIYRTGDLVRYNIDGSLQYIGRKDTQTKVNGQRLELNGIEEHVMTWSSTSELQTHGVTVVPFDGKLDGRSRLAAFLDLGRSEDGSQDMIATSVNQGESLIKTLRQHLLLYLPGFMIPAHFFFVRNLPKTTSGKINRLRLRDSAVEFAAAEQESSLNVASCNIDVILTTPEQLVLQHAWTELLEIPAAKVMGDPSFFKQGGDSIIAMKLVAKLRESDFTLSVADIFKHETFFSIASVVRRGSTESVEIPEFSLVNVHERQEVLESVTRELRVSAENVEDIYPCTPMQEGLIALSAQTPGKYIGSYSWRLADTLDMHRFKEAWKSVWSANRILRTRIIQLPRKMLQVVLFEECPWEAMNTSHDQESAEGITSAIDPSGGRLVKLQIGPGLLQLDIHHALFDEWSLNLLMKQVESAYRREELRPRRFNPFVHHLQSKSIVTANEFWRNEFTGFQGEHFPLSSSNSAHPLSGQVRQRKALTHVLKADYKARPGFTLSTVIRLAWAIVLWRQTGCEDVVFGSTVSGRSTDIDGIDQISGPTIATVPVRIRLPIDQSVEHCLLIVQSAFASMIEHEQTGLSAISQMGSEAAEACNFQNLLVIQPPRGPSSYSDVPDIMKSTDNGSDNLSSFSSYPLVLICRPSGENVSFTASFQPEILSSNTSNSILKQLAHICQQLLTGGELKIENVSITPQEDIAKIRDWNLHLPATVDECIHHRIHQACLIQPERVAACSLEFELTYGQLKLYADHYARILNNVGVQQGDMVPLLFDKTPWTAVALLAVLQTGAAFALLDPSHPSKLLQDICSMLGSAVIFSSTSMSSRSQDLVSHVIVVDGKAAEQATETRHVVPERPARVSPDDAAYVTFSSGSTGVPKGIIVPHSAISTIAQGLREFGTMNPDTRVFQFSSPAFDVCVGDFLFTLACGGCICIPHDEDRKSDISKSLRDLKANYADLTPAVLSLIDPDEVPDMKTFVCGGEALPSHLVKTWAHRVQFVPVYGPAECAIISHITSETHYISDSTDIGRSPIAVSWVVDRHDHNRLVPIGTVGELIIEGAIVGTGYLKEPEKTAAVFIEAPSWLTDFRAKPGRLYKTGDLVRYTPDGTLQFLGRKDFQVKLNGQRVETGEIENALAMSFPSIKTAVVEMIKVPGPAKRSMLVAFICLDQSVYGQMAGVTSDAGHEILKTVEYPTDEFYSEIESMASELSNILPSYMVPSTFVPTSDMPLTVSGKVDRRAIREQILSWSAERLSRYRVRAISTGPGQEPGTKQERKIQQLVAEALDIPLETVTMDRSLFELGGDSILAMQLAKLSRREGLLLTVPQIFNNPILSDMANLLSLKSDKAEGAMKSKQRASLCREPCGNGLSKILPADIFDNIEDILPTSEFQAMTLHNFYSRYLRIHLPPKFDHMRLLEACNRLVQKHSSLRTAFTKENNRGIVQLVLRSVSIEFFRFDQVESLDEHCAEDSINMGIPINGKPAFQVQLVELSDSNAFLLLRLPHALFDGLSAGVICEDLAAAYNGQPLTPNAQFSDYIRASSAIKTPESYQIWKKVLHGSQMTTLKNPDNEGAKSHSPSLGETWLITATTTAPLITPPPNITMATLVKAAWAAALRLWVSNRNNSANDQISQDIVFGQVVHGRGLDIEHEERIVGPCINIVPVRVQFQPKSTKLEVLEQVQRQHIDTMPVESLGMADIFNQCTSWAPGTKFGSFVRFQNFVDGQTCNLGDVSCETNVYSLPNRPSPTANVLVMPRESELTVKMTVSNDVMSQREADLLVETFCNKLQNLRQGVAEFEYI
ncbi:hypothetical protein N7456_001311 [Penicillium angulare]|uniref:Carrier domain-containing protein n=1 Tax=Penicillium angulare TaxID=116970 RepID=A0A9W9GF58_9EURO|nr:hypothetical protein N7456_001311 [Penicillium angulare]